MIDEAQLRERFLEEYPILQAWGTLVAETVLSELTATLSPADSISRIIKIPPEPRVKGVASFIEKALYRKKPYTDPLKEITDKVGVRFVTILAEDVAAIGEIVNGCTLWRAELARNYEQERRLRPNQFDYQSQHYVVFATAEYRTGNVNVPAGTPCEVQIRTLLQHAYAELAHEATYKPKTSADETVRRELAKCMALIETTSDLFSTVNSTINRTDKALRDQLAVLHLLYSRLIGPPQAGDSKLGVGILDHYRNSCGGIEAGVLERFLGEKDFVVERIERRAKSSAFFANPIVLAVYYWTFEHRGDFLRNWPHDQNCLLPVLSDLGLSDEVLL